MPRSEGQHEQIRRGKQQITKNAALELFAKNGFHITSINQTSNPANASKRLTDSHCNIKSEKRYRKRSTKSSGLSKPV